MKKKTIVGREVEITDNFDPYYLSIGTLACIVNGIKGKDYIVQLDLHWSYFRRWQFKVLPKRGKK